MIPHRVLRGVLPAFPLLIGGLPPAATAAVHTYTFEATVSSIGDGGQPAAFASLFGVTPGSTVTGWLSYDTTGTERAATLADPTLAEYWGLGGNADAVASFEVTTPARVYSLISPPSVSIRIRNDFEDENYVPTQIVDGFGLQVSSAYDGSNNPEQFSLGILLEDHAGATLSATLTDDAIPGPLPTLDQWRDARTISLGASVFVPGEGGFDMGWSAELTRLTEVPEPVHATWLGGLAALGWALGRRLRRGA
jgi:hypothetical protein